jgi:FdhE protein
MMDTPVNKLRRSRERMPHFQEVLQLAERFLVEKCQMKDRQPGTAFLVDPVKAKIQMKEGFPYLRPADVPLDLSRMEEYFSCLLKGLAEVNPARYESLKKTMEAKNFDLSQSLARLLRNQLSEHSLEAEFEAGGSLLFFFLVQTLKPIFEKMAEGWRTSLKDLSWTAGYCPFCGALPGMGEIRKEGKRILHCPLCGTEWEFPRMKCPYCQNEDQERLTYFQVEGEGGNRADVCLACRNYLKTVDSRDMEGTLDFEVEDYLTLYLDHLAQEEGFIRPGRLFVDMK